MAKPVYLFVINSFGAGGAERSLVELLPRLEAKGIAPVIACLEAQQVGFEQEVRTAGHDMRILQGSGIPSKIRALRAMLKDLRPALVYTSLFDADITGRLASIGIDVPVMSLLANTAYDPARLADPSVKANRLKVVKSVDGFTARHLTDHFHAVSQAVKDSTVETLRVDPDRITVVYRGRDTERLGTPSDERRLRMRQTLDLAENAEVVLTVGRQEYQKGHTHLVAAFAGIAAERAEAVLLIAGREGHASTALRAQIDSLNLSERVRLLGHRSDVPDVLAAADLFVFPSVYEGLGGALIEALALALPVVASDLPALGEVVVEGENALLVPPASPAELQSAIVDLLGDPKRRRRFGIRSRELFDQRFQADAAADQFVALLESVAR